MELYWPSRSSLEAHRSASLGEAQYRGGPMIEFDCRSHAGDFKYSEEARVGTHVLGCSCPTVMSGVFRSLPSGSSAEYDITTIRISGCSGLGGVALQLLLLSAGEGEYNKTTAD